MASRRQQQPERPAPRLYLVTPAPEQLALRPDDVAAALAAGDVAAVLLHLGDGDERTLINRAKALAPLVQKKDAALILAGHPQLVAKSGADGAHLTGIDAFDEAVGALKPDRIAGAGGLDTRHDAMLAAEHGADYVMFGEPDDDGEHPAFAAILDRVSWWADVFETPCVGYARTLDEVAQLAAAGVDFVAIDFVWSDPQGVAAAVAAAMHRLAAPEPAA
jgi:thiamine-phosphate pyrophosphorylase